MVFITTTVIDWTPLFNNESLAQSTLAQLQETVTRFETSVAGYVLMPSHLHALLGFTQVGRLSQLMQAFKGLSSRRMFPLLADYKQLLSELGGGPRVWKPRFEDLIIWSEKQFKIKIEYIHNNPVKAGLVEQAIDYRFSSARDWLTDSPGVIKVDKNWSWYDGRLES